MGTYIYIYAKTETEKEHVTKAISFNNSGNDEKRLKLYIRSQQYA